MAKNRNIPLSTHHNRFSLSGDLPYAQSAISWLYSQIILPEDINRYSRGILNMHGGKIPEYRGASVLHWSIINGENQSGVTWHEIIEEVDAGGIWAESFIPIFKTDTALDVRRRMIKEGIALFPNAWARFCDPNKKPYYPDLTKGKVWPQRTPKDSQIGNNWSVRQVLDMVRAMCPPWPPAYIETSEGILLIRNVQHHQTDDSIPYYTSDGVTLYLVTFRESDS